MKCSRTLSRLTIGAAGALLMLPGAASAATINVDTTADENAVPNGRCALREAISSANVDAPIGGCVGQGAFGIDTINLPAGTYRLTQGPASEDLNAGGDLDIGDGLTIRHQGIAPAIVDGNGTDRVFDVTSAGQVTLSGITIQNGDPPSPGHNGGGMISSGGPLVVNDVTFRNNEGQAGGAFAGFAGTFTFTNVTMSGNRAEGNGGAITTAGGVTTITVQSSTITNNTADSDSNTLGNGGGVATGGAGSLILRNTIVAGNTDTGGEAPDCFEGVGPLSSSGDTLIGNTTGCGGIAPGPGDIPNGNPRLNALLFNGGPTPTHAIGRESQARNAGSSCPDADQRGVPRFLGGPCDIGAYEYVRCGFNVVNRVGTGGRDVLKGTGRADGFLLFAGNDVGRGFGRNDSLCGGRGRDRLFGGNGRDRLFGQAGPDRLFGGRGRDLLFGQRGRDRLFGGKGRDKLKAGAGRDRCFGGPGRDNYKSCERIRG